MFGTSTTATRATVFTLRTLPDFGGNAVNHGTSIALKNALSKRKLIMAIKSTFDRGGDGMTRGGLDRYLGPPAVEYSNMPENIDDANPLGEPDRSLDCSDADSEQAVCQIAKAEEEKRQKPDVK